MSPTYDVVVSSAEEIDLGAQGTPQTVDRTVYDHEVRPTADRTSRPTGATAHPIGVFDPHRLAAAPARGVRT
ncbi:hypothetical protein [Streptomyces sp. SAS_270]|uniref:hypothetical protein n=1 Tax=Streptomyces sp. SAS_270 TaxID=3412748 RepID=UPI00403C2AA5